MNATSFGQTVIIIPSIGLYRNIFSLFQFLKRISHTSTQATSTLKIEDPAFPCIPNANSVIEFVINMSFDVLSVITLQELMSAGFDTCFTLGVWACRFP